MLPILVDALGIPSGNRLPLDEWVAFVRDFPANALNKDQNPATVLADFLEHDFQRMPEYEDLYWNELTWSCWEP
ncbi:unnamed protein product [Penicillium discolor]